MAHLRTTVLMKTDIAESTPQFRALLPADIQAFLAKHRAMLERLSATEGGRILKPTGDGFWLEFPSATGAAKCAVALQEALHLEQPMKGDNRLAMRIVIGLGDTATQDGELIGDVLALIARIEAITPPEETYLTSAARLALTQSEIRTSLVGRFSLKGFPEEEAVYRVEQRHRTHVVNDAWVLVGDLRGFGRFSETEREGRVEELLNTLESVIITATHEFDGTVQFAIGDSYHVTFPDAASAISAAERISRSWTVESDDKKLDCQINVCLHRGTMKAFRSFVYGEGIWSAARLLPILASLFERNTGSVFVTGPVRQALCGSPWQERLQRVLAESLSIRFPDIEVFRLESD